MTAEDFVELLERSKKSGTGWEARCPAHLDRSPSLSIDEGDDGKILLRCHAGCTVEEICDALEIDMQELFPAQGEFEDEASRMEKTYDYEDETGQLLFQVVRYREPKGFRQRVKDGLGWNWSVRNVRKVPYRLPELIKGADEARPAWICEGEKDADELTRLGLVATTSAGGSSAWNSDYADYFARHPDVFVVAHCDKPGRQYANNVARSLYERGVRVYVIELDANRDDGYDAYDFSVEHGDEVKTKLILLSKRTPLWSPHHQRPQRSLPIQTSEEFLSNVPEYQEDLDYVGPFVHGGLRIHVAGPIGHGKTTLLMEACSAAVHGEDFLGWRGKGDLKVLYIDLEMPAELLGQAVRDARLDGHPNFHLVHLPDGLRIDTNPEDREMLERAVEGFHVLVIDPWYKLMEQEMEYNGARSIIACLDGIRSRHPELCTLVGFHAQEPQYPSEKLSLGNISGFKIFQRPSDIVLTFQRLKENTSRIVWVKNRSPRLGVNHGEAWELEWERGWGFTRTDNLSMIPNG